MRILRSIFRHRLRSFLTIFGITIGVFALVVMGSLAEKMTLLVEGGTEYYADKVQVGAGGGAAAIMGIAPLSLDVRDDLLGVEGVAYVSAEVGTTLEELGAVNFGTPASFGGSDSNGPESDDMFSRTAEGRTLVEGDDGVALVGADLVEKLGAEIGGMITVRGEEFEVVGILEKTFTSPDTTVEIPFANAQQLFHKTLPPAVREGLNAEELASAFIVYPEDGVDPDKLAERIEDELADVTALGPAGFEEQIGSQIGIFSSIVYAVALVSLLVGGLSVVNTMTMSVLERTREIGIRKAIGATDRAVLGQFVGEAAVVGLIGGLAGLGLGALVVQVYLASTSDPAAQIFLLTPRLAIGSVVFALVLGIVSGLYPARRAARLNPVQALRAE